MRAYDHKDETYRKSKINTCWYGNCGICQHDGNVRSRVGHCVFFGFWKNHMGAGGILDHGNAVCIIVYWRKMCFLGYQATENHDFNDGRAYLLGDAAVHYGTVFWGKLRCGFGNCGDNMCRMYKFCPDFSSK